MNGTKLWIAAGGLCVFACAHAPAPTEQVASSLAAVRAAEEAGAKENPEAALHVKLAQEQLQQAHELMEHEHNAKAKDKAMRARNDAELALSLTHEQQANKKLESFRQAHQTAAQPAPQGDMQ